MLPIALSAVPKAKNRNHLASRASAVCYFSQYGIFANTVYFNTLTRLLVLFLFIEMVLFALAHQYSTCNQKNNLILLLEHPHHLWRGVLNCTTS